MSLPRYLKQMSSTSFCSPESFWVAGRVGGVALIWDGGAVRVIVSLLN